jgi:hypothetical protein
VLAYNEAADGLVSMNFNTRQLGNERCASVS